MGKPEKPIPLTNDAAFKLLFGQQENSEALASLINAIRYDRPPIVTLQIIDPVIMPEMIRGKTLILDVLAQDARGQQFNVEMQVRRQREWGDRIACYAARMFGAQLQRGQDYAKLEACSAISLLDFDLYDTEDHAGNAIWSFGMRELSQDSKLSSAVLSDKLEARVIEMRKLQRLRQGNEQLAQWVRFLKEPFNMETITIPEILKAEEAYRRIMSDKRAQAIIASMARASMDEVTRLAEARREAQAEGREEGREEVAVRLISMGMDADTIVKATGLSIHQVNALRT